MNNWMGRFVDLTIDFMALSLYCMAWLVIIGLWGGIIYFLFTLLKDVLS